MGELSIDAAAITHIGTIKKQNEDNYFVNGKYMADSSVGTEGIADKKKRNSYTYAVCDGMGGESYGEFASLIAVTALAKYMQTDIRESIDRYINTANEFICDLIKKNRKIRSGSTLALLSIQKNTAAAYNIGDSRVYLCRKGDLYLLTQDDVDPEHKSNLTQYIGISPEEMRISVHKSEVIKLKKGDVFMLCSDGLYDVIDDEDIVEFLSNDNDSATDMTKKLVAVAQENNGIDNVTVVVAKAF